MDRHEEIDNQILSYLDGSLSRTEKDEFEKILRTNDLYASRLKALQAVHINLKSQKLEEPSRNFTDVVMSRLQEGTSRISIVNGILLLAGVIMLIIICLVFQSSGIFDVWTTVNPNEVNLLKKYVPQELPTFGFNGKILVDVIVILNLVIAFILLDRSVLKPFFQRRAGSSV
jgi:hypothetical protein